MEWKKPGTKEHALNGDLYIKPVIVTRGCSGGSDSKEAAYSAEDPGSIPRLADPLEKEVATHSSILAWRIT